MAVSSVHVRETGPEARRPTINEPSASVTPTNGIVIGVGPVTIGVKRPATLLTSTTPAAPAAWASAAFTCRVQTPRTTTTIVPARLPDGATQPAPAYVSGRSGPRRAAAARPWPE